MDDWDRFKIAAGVAGVLALLCIFTVISLVLEGYLAYSSVEGVFKVDGPTEWRARSDEVEDEAFLHRNIASTWNLNRQYETVTEFGNLRDVLYLDRAFEAVDRELETRFATIEGPLDFRLYSTLHAALGELRYGDDPNEHHPILDAWVDSHPESRHALIVRAHFLLDLAWYFRGTGDSSSVLRDNRLQFKKFVKLARKDLERAQDMNAADPDAAALLIRVAMALDWGRSYMEAYYDQALAANPNDLAARINKLQYLLPQWCGTWEEADTFLVECDQARRTFPLMGIVRRIADEEMRSRDATYDVAYNATGTRQSWCQVYIDQLAHTPDKAFLQANVAYFAMEARDYALASEYFEIVGDRYPAESKFHDIVVYSEKRAEAYINHGSTRYGDEELVWKERAVVAAPHSALANYAYGEVLLRHRDYAKGESHLQTATGLDPDYAPPYISLALLTEATGRYHEARRYAQQALRANPDAEHRYAAEAILSRLR